VRIGLVSFAGLGLSYVTAGIVYKTDTTNSSDLALKFLVDLGKVWTFFGVMQPTFLN